MYFVYILKSESIDSFYVGETNDIETRLMLHNTGEFDFSFTKQANDWAIYFKMECPNRSIARKIELHIKKMKSRKYFESLSKYPEMTKKLLDKYLN